MKRIKISKFAVTAILLLVVLFLVYAYIYTFSSTSDLTRNIRQEDKKGQQEEAHYKSEIQSRENPANESIKVLQPQVGAFGNYRRGEPLASFPKDDKYSKDLVNYRSKVASMDKGHAIESVNKLGRLPAPGVADTLLDILQNDPRAEVRAAAAYTLAVYPGDSTINERIISIFQNEQSPDVRSAIVEAVARRGGEGAVDFLMNVLQSNDSLSVRTTAAYGLSRVGDAQLAEKLADIENNQQDAALQKAIEETRLHLTNQLNFSSIGGCVVGK